LFADVVASTELLASLGDEVAARRVRAALVPIEESVTWNEGRIVKWLAGGLFAVFDSARAAIAAAAAASSVLAGEDSDRPRVRMAVHVGQVHADGDYLAGTVVATASRLCDMALPGSVLVTGAARSMAGPVLGVGFRDLGSRRLKGIPEPVRVWGLKVEGVLSGGGRLASDGGGLVGRVTEMATISEQLGLAMGSRGSLIVISGEPGIGKTRVAEAAITLASRLGFETAWSAAWERGASQPFATWTELLRSVVGVNNLEVTESDRAELGAGIA
jgi:hypothetical protein